MIGETLTEEPSETYQARLKIEKKMSDKKIEHVVPDVVEMQVR